MANVLKMDKQTLIKQLIALGWSYRRIHRETGIHRDTIAKYDPNHPKWANLPTDTQPENTAQNRPKHALSAVEGCPPTKLGTNPSTKLGIDPATPSGLRKPTRTSPAERYDVVIRQKLEQKLSQKISEKLIPLLRL